MVKQSSRQADHRDQTGDRPQRQSLSALDPRSVQQLARRLRLADPDRLLRPLLAAVEWSASGAVRPGAAALLPVRSGPVAAGHHLPDHPAAAVGAGAIPVHRRRRPPVVWLQLPADGLYRNIPVGGKWIEGDRPQRIKLDAAPRTPAKNWQKDAETRHLAAISLWTGLTFVGYFTPIRELLVSLGNAGTGAWEIFWVLFYGGATYGMAGFLREHMCKYICPYAQFQFVMFDRDTLIVAYDAQRGETRGSRPKNVRSARSWTRRLHRLQHLRPGLPDRHRHPRRPAA
jgi:hypothetical protein